MGKVSKFSVMLAMALLMSAAVPHASADPCGDQLCEETAPPELEVRDEPPSRLNDRQSIDNGGDVFRSRKEQRRAERNRKRQRRLQEIYSQPGIDDDEGRYVQYNDQDEGLIGETEALTQAEAAVPGSRALGIKLLNGQTPRYAVKLRVRGKVRRIYVDARTGQVLGE